MREIAQALRFLLIQGCQAWEWAGDAVPGRGDAGSIQRPQPCRERLDVARLRGGARLHVLSAE